jgi:hypothetical protein
MSVKSLYELTQRRGGPALRARLKHIDDRLVWFGFVRLANHASKFGISEVQGKIDLQTYRNLSATPPPDKKPGPTGSVQPGLTGPGIYERPAEFIPLFDGPRVLEGLLEIKLPDARPDVEASIVSLSAPSRLLEPDRVRSVLAAIELKTCARLTYQSMTSRELADRIVSPHTLVKASGRWHVRAFDYQRKRFIDFSLSRIVSSAPSEAKPSAPIDLDYDWHEHVPVELIPHPDLSKEQQAAVAQEFKMTEAGLSISVRRALLFYLLDEMRLLTAVSKREASLGKATTLWVRNVNALSNELSRMQINVVRFDGEINSEISP